MKNVNQVDRTAVVKVKLAEAQSDFAYWQTHSHVERLAVLESIRQEYHDHDEYQQGFQRVYKVIKRT